MDDENTKYLTPEQIRKIKRIETIGQNFLANLTALGSSRELSLSRTKLEEAVMWAREHVAK